MLWPWCDHEEALALKALHARFITVAGNDFSLWPGPYSNITQFGPMMDTALLNSFVVAKRALLASGNLANPTQYMDDTAGQWGSQLDVFKASVISTYMPYVTAMKRLACSRTWLASQGACVTPQA